MSKKRTGGYAGKAGTEALQKRIHHFRGIVAQQVEQIQEKNQEIRQLKHEIQQYRRLVKGLLYCSNNANGRCFSNLAQRQCPLYKHNRKDALLSTFECESIMRELGYVIPGVYEQVMQASEKAWKETHEQKPAE